VHTRSYVWWLGWQRRGELTCVCALVVCPECPYLLWCPPICRYLIRSDLAEVFVYPGCAGVEYKRKMITRGSGKPGGLYSELHVRTEYVAADMTVMLKMSSTEYGCRLQGFPATPQFAMNRSHVVCLLAGINCSVRRPE
jgi:hypothetical protein